MTTTSFQYLDAAATAPLLPEAREAMLRVLDGGPGNPSSVHSAGHRAATELERARATIATSLGARLAELICTAGGTEANNLAIIGLSLSNPRGRHLITTPIEHPSVLESCDFLRRMHGFEVTMLPVDRFGLVDLDALRGELREDTTLVTIGLANGEVGTVQAVEEIARVVRGFGRGQAPESGSGSGDLHGSRPLLHCDAVQAAASLPIGFGPSGWPGEAVDALSIASHKFGGPQGAGALLLRAGLPIEPLLHGGGQEGGRRSGTENTAALAGFAAAVRVTTARVGGQALRLIACRDKLIARVLASVPGATLTGHPVERLPGHASFVVSGVSGESLLVALDTAGLAASSGSACAAGKDEPSPALIAMGYTAELAQTAIRFTLHDAVEPWVIEQIAEVMRAEAVRAESMRPEAVHAAGKRIV